MANSISHTESPAAIQYSPLHHLLHIVKHCRKILIVCHNFPDPDAISSAAALKYLLQKTTGIICKIAFGGAITRPENRTMLRLLKIQLVPLSKEIVSSYCGVACVDTQPQAGNNSLPREIQPLIVIDHHPPRRISRCAPFHDLRVDYGATATILTEYLIESGLPIPTALVTALFYGIASETQDLGREAVEADNRAYMALFPKSNKRILAQIRNARMPREYFQNMESGLRNSFTYKNVIGSRLGKISGQEVVPFMADLLIRQERISWAIVQGRSPDNLYVSIRTHNQRAHAGRLLRRVLGTKGSAGGHGMMAGGFVPIQDMSTEQIKKLEEDIFRRFLAQVGHKDVSDLEQLILTGTLG